MRSTILNKLQLIEDSGVRILYAVESGSRAWGWESSDSDYDVRFIFHYPQKTYLNCTSFQKL